MPNSYKLVLDDALQEGQQLHEVKARLAMLFRVDALCIEKLFSSSSPVIKSKLSKEKALKYKQAVERTGAMCRIVPEKHQTAPTSQKIPQKESALIYRTKILRQEVGVYKYVVWPFVRVKNAAVYIFDHIAGMIWAELMGKSPNYSQLAQLVAFLIFSTAAYTLWHIPEYSYKVFLVLGLLLWLFDRFLIRRHVLQTNREIYISLKYQHDGRLVWRRKNPSGEHDTLSCAADEAVEVTLAREHVEGGAFRQVIGAVWRIYLILLEGDAFLLDEHADVLQALRRAKHVARRLNIPVIFENSEGRNSLSAKELKGPQALAALKHKSGSSGRIKVKKSAKGTHISSAWNFHNVRMLVDGMLRRSGFLLFLLIVEGFMVKYGLLLNWLINPYLGRPAPDFPFELSFWGVFSLFAPEGDWKEWLKFGMILALMLYQGINMSRRKSIVIGREKTSVFVGKKLLTSLNTSQLDFPLLVTAPAPLLILTDSQRVAQLHNFQTDQELRAFMAAIDQGVRDHRQA